MKKNGGNVTSQELWKGYLTHFNGRREVSLYPQCEFRRITRLRVRGLFGKTLVHSIDRRGRAQRGYNDLCLVTQPHASPGNHKDDGAPVKHCPPPMAGSTADSRANDHSGAIEMPKDAKGVTDATDAADRHAAGGVAEYCVSNPT
jgi:hypothetical protein